MPDTRLAGLVRSDAGRRILTGEGEGALAGMRVGAAPASIRMYPLLRPDLRGAVSVMKCTGGA
jgi:hypothetical protein